MKQIQVNQAVASGLPGQEMQWVAAGHLYFDSVEAFQGAFGPHGAEIMGDIPNFTNVQPYVVISQQQDA